MGRTCVRGAFAACFSRPAARAPRRTRAIVAGCMSGFLCAARSPARVQLEQCQPSRSPFGSSQKMRAS